ncbi:hypothetical protein ACFL9T_13940 [Thermodesulfobacteriota bacterium]
MSTAVVLTGVILDVVCSIPVVDPVFREKMCVPSGMESINIQYPGTRIQDQFFHMRDDDEC